MQTTNDLKTLQDNERIINHFKHTQRTEPSICFVLTEQQITVFMYLLYWYVSMS